MGRRPAARTSPRALSESEVDGILTKLRKPDPLGDTERSALIGIVETWAHLQELAALNSTGMREIRQVLGVRQPRGEPPKPAAGTDASQTPQDSCVGDDHRGQAGPEVSAEAKADQEEPKKPVKRDAHGRRGPGAFGKLAEAHHVHTSIAIGDHCPECARGRLYKYRPDQFTTISGQSPLVATRHTVDALQCNLCKAVFKAPLPQLLVDDGVQQGPLYTFSAVAIVATYRFFAGLPMHRQDRLQRALGVAVPDASIFDMCERLADVLRPVHRELHDLAGDALLFYGDDTGATILEARAKVRRNRRTGTHELRTGCHTTCVIAIAAGEHAVTLFVTGIHHTGEVMDLVLAERDHALPPPIFMGDCVSSNVVTKTAVLYAGCNAHAVRRFKAIVDRYPEETSFVLERYKRIYENEDHCRSSGLVGEARRDYHRDHSRPLLREITEYGQDLFEKKRVEPNSDLGQALNYVIDHERRLSAFARHPLAPIDNNRCERELRICVQLRDTALFFRNAIGAGVADTLLSVGATALAAGETLPEYFVAAQRYARDVREHPELGVPWRYRERLRTLDQERERGPPLEH